MSISRPLESNNTYKLRYHCGVIISHHLRRPDIAGVLAVSLTAAKRRVYDDLLHRCVYVRDCCGNYGAVHNDTYGVPVVIGDEELVNGTADGCAPGEVGVGYEDHGGIGGVADFLIAGGHFGAYIPPFLERARIYIQRVIGRKLRPGRVVARIQ